jgi:hypothetical protein
VIVTKSGGFWVAAQRIFVSKRGSYDVESGRESHYLLCRPEILFQSKFHCNDGSGGFPEAMFRADAMEQFKSTGPSLVATNL